MRKRLHSHNLNDSYNNDNRKNIIQDSTKLLTLENENENYNSNKKLKLNNEKENESIIHKKFICTYDMLYQYRMLVNPCRDTACCNFIHYNYGPQKIGLGWKDMTKSEILLRLGNNLKGYLDIYNHILNDNTLKEEIVSIEEIIFPMNSLNEKNQSICLFDLYEHYNVIRKNCNTVLSCNLDSDCQHLHYNCGPHNYGWKVLTKNQLLSILPKYFNDSRIISAINNDSLIPLYPIINLSIDKCLPTNLIQKKICLLDISYHYNLPNNKGKCKFTFCQYLHYDVGPYNNGNGWKNMTKSEIIEGFPKYKSDLRLLNAIENDDTLRNN